VDAVVALLILIHFIPVFVALNAEFALIQIFIQLIGNLLGW
jgi:hypothetical protein